MEKREQGVVDIEALSKEIVDAVLGPYIQFDPQRQEFIFTEAWHELSNKLKVITYLIGRKGNIAKGLLDDEEAVAPKTIVLQTGLPSGSVAPALKEMLKTGEVDKTSDGKYLVPNRALLKVRAMIEKAGETREKPARKTKRRRKK